MARSIEGTQRVVIAAAGKSASRIGRESKEAVLENSHGPACRRG